MKRTCAVFIAMALMLCALPAFAAQSDGFTVSDVGAIDVEQFSDGYAPYYSDGLYGIVRYDGRIISEPVYQDIRAYGENLWPVRVFRSSTSPRVASGGRLESEVTKPFL